MKKPTLKFTPKQQFPQHFLLVYTLHFNCINERFGSAEWIKYATGKIQKALRVKYQLSQGMLGSILPFNCTFSFRHCCENVLVKVCNSFYFPFLGVFSFPYLKTLLFRAFVRGTQREYSLKPLKHSIVERILVFKRQIQAYFYPLKIFLSVRISQLKVQ